MRKLLLSAVVVCCALIFVSAASADTMSFSLSGSGWSTSGTFVGSPTAPGTWLVSGASGSFDGTAITGVWPTSNNGNIFSFNNLHYWPAPVFDIYGVVLTLANGDLVNLCYDTGCAGAAGTYTAITWDPNACIGFLNADTVAFGQPTPEPGTLALLGTSMLGLVGVVDRKSTRLNSSHSGESRMPSSA